MNGSNLNGSNLNGSNINGSNLNGSNLNGSSLNGVDLQGVDPNVDARFPGVFSDGSTVDLVITALERTDDPDLVRYRVEANGKSICDGDGKGVFLNGVWDESGARHDELVVGERRLTTSFSCTDGVLAKCIAWGYAPWRAGADAHQACTRMARADYCGSGVSFTKEGTEIDVYDAKGIQKPTGEASYVFEAGWGPAGAVCVSRTRFDARLVGGTSIMPSCWSALPKCESAVEAYAQGAAVANSSHVGTRTFCESD